LKFCFEWNVTNPVITGRFKLARFRVAVHYVPKMEEEDAAAIGTRCNHDDWCRASELMKDCEDPSEPQ
jgi:hypothetical protein